MNRPKIPIPTQVEVLFREGWICSLCQSPTIFHLSMKYLTGLVAGRGLPLPTAYFHPRWRRDSAPLLDYLGSVIDHVEAYSSGGAHDATNFAVACNKCNGRKNNSRKEVHLAKSPTRR